MAEFNYKLVTTDEDLRKAAEHLSQQPVLGFDSETTSLDPYAGRLRLVQLAAPDGVYVFDLFALAPNGDAAHAESLEPLRRLLSAKSPVKVAHNSKFDAKWVRLHLGVELAGDYDSRSNGDASERVERGGLFDTMLASQIISAGEQEDRHSLGSVAARYLDEELDKSQQVSDWGGELSAAQLEYAARDAAVMLPLREKLVEQLRANALGRCAQLEFECVVPVAALELAGIFLDKERWREQLSVVEKKRTLLAAELQDILSEESAQQSFFGPSRVEINLDSHVQLTKALTRLGVPVPDSTRNWKLQPLAHQYPVVARLLEYRTVQKALTSYGENILKEINPKTGRIHANFHQIGAPTGRFACTNPNVQQVPHSIEYRRCFRAPEGRKFVISDYCVVSGTRVATRRGLMVVEEVQAGDEVYLEDGSAAKVSAAIRRGKLPTVTVTLKNGYSLTATSLHRVRVLDEEGRYVWRRIGELKKTDFVAIQPGRGLHDRLAYVKLPEAVSKHRNNHKTLTTPRHADERLATFMGYIAGDGTIRRNIIGWVVNSQDEDVFEEIHKLASELFSIPVHERGAYRGVHEAGLYSIPLAEWCLAAGLSKGRVPEFLWRSKTSVVAAYLRALFEADGSVTDSDTGKASFASSRRQLAVEVHQLLLALGIPATLREQRDTGPEKKFKCWHVSVVASGLRSFAGQVGFMSERKQAKLRALLARQTGKTVVGNMPNLQRKIRALHLSGEARRLLNNTSSLGRPVSAVLAHTVEKDYPEVAHVLGLQHVTGFKQLFLPVVKLEPAGEQEVFDLSVPGPMTYISDGFVSHNSQIELRILADFTGDKGFVDAFNSGADLHRVTAAQVFGVPTDAVTKEQRDFAKRLNFGVVYGIGAQRFAMMTGLPQSDAEDILRRYFSTYRALDAWLREAANKAVRERTAPRTVAGRLFRFNFDPEDRQAASLAQRNGKNSPIQGCLCGETRVFEASVGYVPIKELNGKAVRVWDGTRLVRARVARSGKRQLVKVEFWGGHYIECSPDHKFLTTDVNGRTKWRTPPEFVKGNYVVLTDGVSGWEVDLSLPALRPGRAWNASKATLADIVDRFELGVFMGRTASDGSVSSRQVTNLVAEHEKEILPYLRRIAEQLGHVTLRPTKREQGRKPLYQLTNSSLGVAGQLLEVGIKERVPDPSWRDKRVLAGYLRGVFDGDGTVNKDGPVLTFGRGASHLNWAREIQEALLLFGIRSRINVCADRINIRVLKRDAHVFAREIGFISSAKQGRLSLVNPSKHAAVGKIYGRAVRIKSVEITDEWIEMYDVVDSESGQFMANGLIVHNSSADIIKRALRLLHDRLKDTSACVVNVIHDEIVVESDAKTVEEVAKTVEGAMCDAGAEYVKKVPVKVESQIADEWVK